MQKSKSGKIIIPPNTNIWPHEIATAQALAASGFTIQFIRKSNREREYSADCYINGEKWELKSPKASHLRTIRKNIKIARRQSEQIVIDSIRIKRIPDFAIRREVIKQTQEIKYIKKLLYVSKNREIVKIK